MAFVWMVSLLLYSAHACTHIDVMCALAEGVQTCNVERLQIMVLVVGGGTRVQLVVGWWAVSLTCSHSTI